MVLFNSYDSQLRGLPFVVSEEYHEQVMALLSSEGVWQCLLDLSLQIEAVLKAFLTPFLRKCCILLYSATPQEEDQQFIVPQEFEKLRLFLELPKPQDYKSVYETLPAVKVFVERSLSSLSSSLTT